MTRLLALAAVLATIFVGLPEARAWECSWAGCAKWCNLPVRYGLGDASPDLGDATTITELRRGFDDWTAVSCTGLQQPIARALSRWSSSAGRTISPCDGTVRTKPWPPWLRRRNADSEESGCEGRGSSESLAEG